MVKGQTANESLHDCDDVRPTAALDAYLIFMIIVSIRNYPAAESVGGGGGHFGDWVESLKVIYSEPVICSEIGKMGSFHRGFHFRR